MKNEIMVSVCMITYNQESYIKQAIEGVLMQKCDSPIELVIGEDFSTDKTRQICEEYTKIKPQIKLLNTEANLGVMPNFIRTLEACTGKYIAICEGDDYWTDPLKLKKQVDFLEENEDCSLCFHASKSIRNNDPNDYLIKRHRNIPLSGKFSIEDAILGGGGFMATNSMVFHSKYIREEKPNWMTNAPVGDIPLMLFLATKGKIGYIDDVMSVYRIMSSTLSWSYTMKDKNKRKTHHYKILKMWTDFDEWTDKRYHKTILKKKKINQFNYFKSNIKRLITFK